MLTKHFQNITELAMRRIALTAFALFYILCGYSNIENYDSPKNVSMSDQMKNLERATFAGGCFWCMEPPPLKKLML